MYKTVIEKQTGQAFEVRKGDRIEIIDIEGQQVSDLFAICKEDHSEFLSTGLTLMFGNSSNKKKLYSNKYRPLLSIEKDDVGVHDFLIPCCRQESYAYLNQGYHANCLDNLNDAFAEYNIAPFPSITAMSIFMSVDILSNKKLKFHATPSTAGNSIIFQAETDLIIGVTACSDNVSVINNRNCTPIGVKVY